MKIGQMQQAKSGAYVFKLGVGINENDSITVELVDKLKTLLGSDILFLQKPQDRIDFLISKGHITAEVGEERKTKIPDFVKFDVNLPRATV